MDTVLDKLEEEDFYYPKARTNSIKRTGLYMAMEECIFFLPIQIIQETIKTGLKKTI